jgi:hypothetical protein
MEIKRNGETKAQRAEQVNRAKTFKQPVPRCT